MTTIVARDAYESYRKPSLNWPPIAIFLFYAVCLLALMLSGGTDAQSGDLLVLGP